MNTYMKRAAAIAAALTTALSFTVSAQANSSFTKAVRNVIAAIHKDDELHDAYFMDYLTCYLDYPDIYNYVVDDPVTDFGRMPKKFDLRDVDGKNYVSPVKSQNPFNTCWAFASVAAAEVSLAYEHGADFNTMSDKEKARYDLSERQPAWFYTTPVSEESLTAASQEGEGNYNLNAKKQKTDSGKAQIYYNEGGYSGFTASLFSLGLGPVYESDAQYRNDSDTYYAWIVVYRLSNDGVVVNYDIKLESDSITEDEYRKELKKVTDLGIRNLWDFDGSGLYYDSYICRSSEGDWSLDDDLRFSRYDLENANYLPPTYLTNDDMEYIFNPAGINAIKKELLSGRAVSADIYADQSMPGDQVEGDGFMRFYKSDGSPAYYFDDSEIWAQYVYDTYYDAGNRYSVNRAVSANHIVTIVGYDDTFPKKYFNDPNRTIGGNGAWIAKNSWGSSDSDDLGSYEMWGSGGSGYFYISYYDQSLNGGISFDFADSRDPYTVSSAEIYDYIPTECLAETAVDSDVYMANIFTAANDEIIRTVGITTATPNCTVKYTMYLLNDESTSPTDGTASASAEVTFDYAGFHKTQLDRGVPVKIGQKYSIVAQVIREDGMNAVEISRHVNRDGLDCYNDRFLEVLKKYGSEYEKLHPLCRVYSKAVVNKGESFLGAAKGKKTEWADWADVVEELKSRNSDLNDSGFDYDNLPVRSYPEMNAVSWSNEIVDPKDSYSAGDIIRCEIKLYNASREDIRDLEVLASVGDIGNDNKGGKVSVLRAGKTKTIRYSYKVKQKDVKAGSITSTVSLTIGGNNIAPLEGISPVSFTVKVE